MTRSFPAPRPSAAARMLLARHRPVLAGGAAAIAVLAALPVLAPGPAPTVPVLTAAADLRWGRPLTADDVVLSRIPADLAPAGALTALDEIRGRLLASRSGAASRSPTCGWWVPPCSPTRERWRWGCGSRTPGSRPCSGRARSSTSWPRTLTTRSTGRPASARPRWWRTPSGCSPCRGTNGRRSTEHPMARWYSSAATEAQASRLAAAQATGRLSVALRSR